MKHIRNIGIFAHVDAGKTTLSEQLLMHAGAIRKIGSVDAGTAHTDSLPVEQRRGISVKASCVNLNWQGTSINLIDTPGHVDFAAEVERSLWALDAAVLVLCGSEGVQPQTEVLFEALKKEGVPTLIFINKRGEGGGVVDQNTLQCTAVILSAPRIGRRVGQIFKSDSVGCSVVNDIGFQQQTGQRNTGITVGRKKIAKRIGAQNRMIFLVSALSCKNPNRLKCSVACAKDDISAGVGYCLCKLYLFGGRRILSVIAPPQGNDHNLSTVVSRCRDVLLYNEELR